ncbi:MAG: hypothetical protein F6K31_37700 [Symploca sp. SIO2G7]|nr:hypothetical protein [Symploca sp. SIO2G7]
MVRWYKGFRCKGDPETIRDIVVRQVHDYDLARFVTSVKPEKRKKNKNKTLIKSSASSRKIQRNIEFYLFVAIESNEVGKVPSLVESKIVNFLEQREQEYRNRLYKIIQWSIPEGFLYEEIKGMAEADFDVYNFTQSIPYQPHKKKQFNDNPFELLDNNSAAIETIQENYQNYEKLLYLLSTLAQGNWETFKKVCQALELEQPRSIQRRLKLLGHLEVSPNGKYWSITPTALVKVKSASGSQEFILCGQQNGDLLRELERCSDINFREQGRGKAPRCVRLTMPDFMNISGIIEHIKSKLGLVLTNAENAARQLADILPDLEAWQVSLPSLKAVQPELYSLKRFDGNDFIDCAFSKQMGMYQLCNLAEKKSWQGSQHYHPILTLFYDADTHTWRQGDWYGLRFLALYYSGQQCLARYDTTTSRLAIPWLQRFPELYERALVLSSGLLPSYQQTEQSLWLLYENIGQDLAEQLTQKLHVTLEYRTD